MTVPTEVRETLPDIHEVEAGYDLVASEYEANSWYDFWGRNEVPEFLSVASILEQKPKVGMDIGCGTGRYAEILEKLCENVYATDLSKNMLALADSKGLKRTRFSKHDISKSFPLRTCDLITVCRVFSHLKRPSKVVSKLVNSCLSKDGLIFISDLHRDHNYTATTFTSAGKKVRIETIKHQPQSLIFAASTISWFYKEVRYADLKWRDFESRYSSIDRSNRRPIFYVMVGMRSPKKQQRQRLDDLGYSQLVLGQNFNPVGATK